MHRIPGPRRFTTGERIDTRQGVQDPAGGLGAHVFTDTELRARAAVAHDARGFGRRCRPAPPGGMRVEMLIGIALIVIAALEIVFIIRTVQANMGRA